MSVRTRNASGCNLKDYLGPSRQLLPSDLPTLRSALCFVLYLQDEYVGYEYQTKQNIPLTDLLKEVASQVCERYKLANAMFVPPVTINEKSLRDRLSEHWKIASKVAKGKSSQKEKQNLEEKLDCLVDILKYVEENFDLVISIYFLQVQM